MAVFSFDPMNRRTFTKSLAALIPFGLLLPRRQRAVSQPERIEVCDRAALIRKFEENHAQCVREMFKHIDRVTCERHPWGRA